MKAGRGGSGGAPAPPSPAPRRARTNAAQYVPAVLLPRGPQGYPLCRWCQRETYARHSTFCGRPCIHAWKLRSDPGYLRGVVFRRDRGVCAACGTDTEALRKWARAHVPCRGNGTRVVIAGTGGVQPVLPQHRALLKARGYDEGRALWAADHVVPVAEGGGQCDLDNIQTLCVPCHKGKSAREAAARRRARTAPAAAPDGAATVRGEAHASTAPRPFTPLRPPPRPPS